jgi:catechol 2,3-dioxygenase-like lactoylglutathione lyase family enzyme
MRVLRLCWLGIPAEEYEPMVRFLRDIMGLRVEFEQPTTTELSLSSGDRVQVFAPGDPYFAFFSEQASGPVALFEVDNVHLAQRAHRGGDRSNRLDRAGQQLGVAALPRAGRQPLRSRQPTTENDLTVCGRR